MPFFLRAPQTAQAHAKERQCANLDVSMFLLLGVSMFLIDAEAVFFSSICLLLFLLLLSIML